MLHRYWCTLKARLHGYVFIRKRKDIVAVSPPVYTEAMKTIMKTQTFEYAIQSEYFYFLL